jgi:hypothetical protein
MLPITTGIESMAPTTTLLLRARRLLAIDRRRRAGHHGRRRLGELVAGGVDGGLQLGQAGALGVPGDGGALSREVHRGFADAVDSAQRALHLADARRAVHAAHR